jgi:hypothetical protein
MILDIIRDSTSDISISYSISLPTNLFTRSHDIASLCPGHMIASFIDATVTKWAQSINPSRGWTNPALSAHASTHTIGIPEDTFSVILSRK